MVDDPELYYALETQAMSTFQSDNVDELTVVHELAHQWFGNAVTVAQWRDLWLAEGFATYFEFLWQHRGDRPGLEADFAGLHAFVVEEGVGPAVVSRPQDLFAFNTYYRGALTLQALRSTVGDDKFSAHRPDLLSHLPQRQRDLGRLHRGRVAEIGGAGVRPLLRAWLYEQPVPPLPGAPRWPRPRRSRPARWRPRLWVSASGGRTRRRAAAATQLSRRARRKLSRIGWIRYSNMVRSPVMIIASAGMPALRRTSGVFFWTLGHVDVDLRRVVGLTRLRVGQADRRTPESPRPAPAACAGCGRR